MLLCRGKYIGIQLLQDLCSVPVIVSQSKVKQQKIRKSYTNPNAKCLLLGMYRYYSIGIGIGGIGLFLWYRLVISVSVNIADTCRYFLSTK